MNARTKTSIAIVVAATGVGCLSSVLVSAIPPAPLSNWTGGEVFTALADASGRYHVYASSGGFIEMIEHAQAAGYATGCKYGPGGLITTDFSGSRIVRWDDNHPHQQFSIPTPGQPRPESIAWKADGGFFVGGGYHPVILEYTGGYQLVRSYTVQSIAGTGGTDWIDLASDQKTIFYTNEGPYVMRYNTVTGQLSHFAHLLNDERLCGMRLLPPFDGTGGLLVADSNGNVKRLDGNGNIVQTYAAPGNQNYFALSLHPDGVTFWVGVLNAAAKLYRFNISTGELVQTIDSPPSYGVCVAGEPLPTPPPPTPPPTPTPTPPTCIYSLTPTSQGFAVGGGTDTVTVETGSKCAWTATSNVSWITNIDPASGTGGTTAVSYTVARNPGPPRTGTITIGNQTFTVTQGALPCTVVTTTADSGPHSLREAIACSNAAPGPAVITFDIPADDPGCNSETGVCTISPVSALPAIADPVIIDGYTQPGSSPNTLIVGTDAVLRVELSGTSAGNASGFYVTASDVTIRGLVINRFVSTGFGSGCAIFDASGHRLTVEGCFLGTDPTGTIALGNSQWGVITLGTGGHRIGGALPAQRNLISGNGGGVDIYEGGSSVATNVLILGNYIGTDRNGTADLGNGIGVLLDGGVNNRVGGPSVGERNVISGNGAPPNGPDAGNGISIANFESKHIVQGNYIGLGADGVTALGNAGNGVRLDFRGNTPANTIGGPNPGEGNVISSNGGHGILISYSCCNTIQGNRIGTAADGSTARGNAFSGIMINHNSNAVGGTIPGAGNVIAFNGNDGVTVSNFSNFPDQNNPILGNSIHNNGSTSSDLGIDLTANLGSAGNGVNPNDHCDPDHPSSVGNHGQNYPVLTSAISSAGSTQVQGTLDSNPNTTFRLEFFSNPTCEASGHGEGRTFVGTTNVTTGEDCNSSFNVSLSPAVAAGQFITATATDPNGNTSEFSGCVEVQAPAAILPISAVSRKMHESVVGDIDLLPPAAGIECRRGVPSGTDFTVVITFADQVNSVGGVTVSSTNNMATADPPVVSGAVVTVNLRNVSDAQHLTITLTNLVTASSSGNATVPMHTLLGDTSNNGSVNATDIGQTKAQSGSPVTATNFRLDVTVNGAINATDIGLVKTRSGATLP
jgi:parallel beta-helix repeat protein